MVAELQLKGNPETDPKAALQWLAIHRKQPTRDPYHTVLYGELVLTKGGLSSLADEELWSFLEQVGIAAIELARWDLAELCVSRVQTRFPESQRVACLQGTLLEGKAEWSKALEFYDLELSRDSTSMILSKRRIATIKALPASHPRGGALKAIEALNKHLDIFYQDPEGWQELAELYAEQAMYSQSIFALEELVLLEPQNSFFQLKYAETLYTARLVARSYKAYLRVLEMCKSDDGILAGSEGKQANGPWVRAVWGTKVCTSAILADPKLLDTRPSEPANDSGIRDIDIEKVKKIDQLVTSLLLEKIYSPTCSLSESDKVMRSAVRAVLGA